MSGSSAPRRRRFDTPDFLAGLIVLATGVCLFVFGGGLSMGSARMMGPGYFPRLLAWLLLGLGALTCARAALATRQPLPAFETRPIGFVLGGIVAFMILLEPAGLVIATAVCVVVSGLAITGRGVVGTLVLAGCAALGATLIFSVLLNLPFPVWPR